jgi:hypothetical protein
LVGFVDSGGDIVDDGDDSTGAFFFLGIVEDDGEKRPSSGEDEVVIGEKIGGTRTSWRHSRARLQLIVLRTRHPLSRENSSFLQTRDGKINGKQSFPCKTKQLAIR